MRLFDTYLTQNETKYQKIGSDINRIVVNFCFTKERIKIEKYVTDCEEFFNQF